MAALGGTNVSLYDHDLNFVFHNPALRSSKSDKIIDISISNYLADITFGTGIYAFSKGENMFSVGMQYVDYGKFDGRDEYDIQTGIFSARDMALYLSYARQVNKHLTLGGTLKPLCSVFETYTSVGAAIDAGLLYSDSASQFSAGFTIRNIGTQFKGYYSDEDGQHYEALPWNIELGISKKLAHAPFRFSLTLHNLQQWNLNYISTVEKQKINLNDTKTDDKPSFVDMAFRHAIIGVEFVPNNSFYVAASYNHRRMQEMAMDGFKTTSGFSFGAGVKLYRFRLGFALSQFQVGNFSYMFSVSSDLNDFGL
jgi:hypothetical protein